MCTADIVIIHFVLPFSQDPPLILPPIPPELRRPLRVLGLFDGIGTGLLVLKELGIEAELYVSSEVDRDAVNVSRVRHVKSIHVGDIRNITEKEVCLLKCFTIGVMS